MTTSHSFKGYEAEVVLIPCADHYVTGDNQILANNLYVAMTRARSILAIYSLDDSYTAVKQLNAAFEFCSDALNATPSISSDVGADIDEFDGGDGGIEGDAGE